MTNISGGPKPTFVKDTVLKALKLNEATRNWVATEVPADNKGSVGDVVFITGGGIYAKTADGWVEVVNILVATNQKTGSYTLALGDAQSVVEMNAAAANTLTVPPNSSVAYPVGTSILVVQAGAGQTTIAGGAGVTVNSYLGLNIIGQWAGCTLIKRATDTWVAVGGLVA
jgi:hypothetical protein